MPDLYHCDDFPEQFSLCSGMNLQGAGSHTFTSGRVHFTGSTMAVVRYLQGSYVAPVLDDWIETRYIFSIDDDTLTASDNIYLSENDVDKSGFSFGHSTGLFGVAGTGTAGRLQFYAGTLLTTSSGGATTNNISYGLLNVTADQEYDISVRTKISTGFVYCQLFIDGVMLFNGSISTATAYWDPTTATFGNLFIGKVSAISTGTPSPIFTFGKFRVGEYPVTTGDCPYCPGDPYPDPSTLPGLYAVYHNGAWHIMPSMEI